jgi:hypothetical protein
MKTYGRKMQGKLSMRWALGLVIGVVIFTAVLPTIANNFAIAAAKGNITGTASATLLGIGTLIVVGLAFAKMAGKI